jgi:murein DD-endopeptidase MepM/ murein hydrolase activator NlpD
MDGTLVTWFSVLEDYGDHDLYAGSGMFMIATSPNRMYLTQSDMDILEGKIKEARGSGFFWPTTSRVITSPFGNRGGGFHDGIDIRGPEGNPVYAAIDGTVTLIRWNSDDNNWYYRKNSDGDYVLDTNGDKIPYQGVGGGYYIEITSHDRNIVTWYMHLVADSATVSRGDTVVAGQQIAELGKTGNGQVHLHFRVHIDGKHVDPDKLDYSNR